MEINTMDNSTITEFARTWATRTVPGAVTIRKGIRARLAPLDHRDIAITHICDPHVRNPEFLSVKIRLIDCSIRFRAFADMVTQIAAVILGWGQIERIERENPGSQSFTVVLLVKRSDWEIADGGGNDYPLDR
jgi:hypothetical protein